MTETDCSHSSEDIPGEIPSPDKRWVVSYIDGDAKDDWQMITNSHKKYFSTEAEAKEFARRHLFPKKPFYWQPSIWKEVEIEYTLKSWRRV